jgi:hypothetical protein
MPGATATLAGDGDRVITYKSLGETLVRAHRCRMTWVMDLAAYKAMRRGMPAQPDGEEDEDKWVPSRDDRLLGLRIIVRDGGGEPHIEWIAPENGR